eukprot:3235698-Rhodomonas_salina.1
MIRARAGGKRVGTQKRTWYQCRWDPPIVLDLRHAMSGSDLGEAATRRCSYGEAKVARPTVLRVRYAMSGTDSRYAATRSVETVLGGRRAGLLL